MGLINEGLRIERQRRLAVDELVTEVLAGSQMTFGPHERSAAELADLERRKREQSIKDFCEQRNLDKLVTVLSRLVQYAYLENGTVRTVTMRARDRDDDRELWFVHINKYSSESEACRRALLTAMKQVEPGTALTALSWAPPIPNGNGRDEVAVTVVFDPALE